jgi:XTP/dITP diphosphohydrolase
MRLVLATRNHFKIEELKYFLKEIPIEILTLNDFPNIPSLVEDGKSFIENAQKKAFQVYERTKLPVLADDSGLEVFYLSDSPGIFSSRYSGAESTDEKNNLKLLNEMKGVAPRRRGAQFRCTLSFIGDGFEEFTEGICRGKLGTELKGINGFGYDPIFLPDGFERTYAELTFEEKAQISHRSRAFEKMKPIILSKIR